MGCVLTSLRPHSRHPPSVVVSCNLDPIVLPAFLARYKVCGPNGAAVHAGGWSRDFPRQIKFVRTPPQASHRRFSEPQTLLSTFPVALVVGRRRQEIEIVNVEAENAQQP
jgi:hypothetical protein